MFEDECSVTLPTKIKIHKIDASVEGASEVFILETKLDGAIKHL